MKRSIDRILTTHAGSLPRPAYVLDMMKAKASGEPYDAASLILSRASAMGSVKRCVIARSGHPRYEFPVWDVERTLDGRVFQYLGHPEPQFSPNP